MFTGIVEKLGKLKTCSEKLLEVEADQHFVDSLKKGDSVSVNGICLTLILSLIHI